MPRNHTVATLDVTAATYDEIARQLREALREAGYAYASQDDGTLDITGIGLILLRCPRAGRTIPDDQAALHGDGDPAGRILPNQPDTSERVTILEDYSAFDTNSEVVTLVTLDAAGQQRLEQALRSGRGATAYSVPKVWWERYVAARTTFRALERELKLFPRYTISWHARLSLAGETIDERETNRWPPK